MRKCGSAQVGGKKRKKEIETGGIGGFLLKDVKDLKVFKEQAKWVVKKKVNFLVAQMLQIRCCHCFGNIVKWQRYIYRFESGG